MKIKFKKGKILLTTIHCVLFSIVLFALDQGKMDSVVKAINSGQYDIAINLLESSGEKSEILLAIAYLGKGDISIAEKFALQYYSKNSDDVVVNFILAQITEENKDYISALKYWNIVLNNSKDKAVKNLAKKHIDVLKVTLK